MKGVYADDGDLASSRFGGQFCLSPALAQEGLSDDCFIRDDSQLGRAVPGAENAVGFFSAGHVAQGHDGADGDLEVSGFSSSFRGPEKGRARLRRGGASGRAVVLWLI